MEPFDRKPVTTRVVFWAVAILLASWGAAELSGRAFGRSAGSGSMDLTIAFGALAAALAALGTAAFALRVARSNRRELDAVSRALDLALRARNAEDRPHGLDEINAAVAREIERLIGRGPAPAADISSTSTEIEPLPRPARKARSVGDVEKLVAGAIAAGTLEISLRPVVSLSRGAAVAFDAFAHFEIDADNRVDVGRIRDGAGSVELAAFERMLVAAAAATARRMLGAPDGTPTPVHVPISDALLASRKELSAVLEMARAHPAAAGSVVLGLPWRTLATKNTFGRALDRLADAGFVLSAEAGDAGTLDPEALGGRARWVRLQSARLLGRRNDRGRAMSGHEIADAMRDAGLGMIADEVQNDDDAIALVDIGVDLMAGPRFSGPRRLRAEAGLPAPAPEPTRNAAE